MSFYANKEHAEKDFKRIEGKNIVGSWWTKNMYEETGYYKVIPDSLSQTFQFSDYEFKAIDKHGIEHNCGLTSEWVICIDFNDELESL